MKKLLTILMLICLFAGSVSGQWIWQQKPMLGQQINHLKAKGLVGYWLMNEGLGNVVNDLSGNNNPGTLVADTHWVPGKFGPCLSFDGTGDYVSFAAITLTGPWTIVFDVIQTKGVGTYNYISYDNGKDYILMLDSLRFRVRGNGVTTTWTLDKAFHNRYRHVVLTSDGTNVTLYLDAVNQGAYALAQLKVSSFGGGPLCPGDLQGKLEYYYIFPRTFSASDAAELYQNPFGMFEPVFPVWWYGGIGGEGANAVPIIVNIQNN